MNKLATTFASMMLAGLIATPVAMAQDNTGGGTEQNRSDRSDRGERGDRGRGWGDPAQIREFIANRLKEQIAPSDEEWGVIKPKLDKVLTARGEQMTGFGGMMRRGGDGGGEEREPRNDTERAVRELEKTLKDTSASPDAIAEKLKALRDARTKAAEATKAAQDDLKGILTARQEAILVASGILE